MLHTYLMDRKFLSFLKSFQVLFLPERNLKYLFMLCLFCYIYTDMYVYMYTIHICVHACMRLKETRKREREKESGPFVVVVHSPRPFFY